MTVPSMPEFLNAEGHVPGAAEAGVPLTREQISAIQAGQTLPASPSASGDKRTAGIYAKFHVERVDGSPRHADCRYFVLDPQHDPYALHALEEYALLCAEEFPALAEDLMRWYRSLDPNEDMPIGGPISGGQARTASPFAEDRLPPDPRILGPQVDSGIAEVDSERPTALEARTAKVWKDMRAVGYIEVHDSTVGISRHFAHPGFPHTNIRIPLPDRMSAEWAEDCIAKAEAELAPFLDLMHPSYELGRGVQPEVSDQVVAEAVNGGLHGMTVPASPSEPPFALEAALEEFLCGIWPAKSVAVYEQFILTRADLLDLMQRAGAASTEAVSPAQPETEQ